MRFSMRAAVPLLVALCGVAALAGVVMGQTAPRPRPGSLPASSAPSTSPSPPKTAATVPGLPVLQLGALLPLTGPSAWFGQEMKNGMELAIADLNPAPRRVEPPTAHGTHGGPSSAGAAASSSSAAWASSHSASSASSSAATPGGPAATLAAPTVQILLDALDVQPSNGKQATESFLRLAAKGAPVVFTASPTPTLAIYPLAAARGVLVVQQGLPSDRLPAGGRILFQTRPSTPARVKALVAYAQAAGFRRLALLAGGDDFGKAARTALSEAWRGEDRSLVSAESFSLDAPELTRRLRALARLAPDAVCLFFEGADLGELARQLRDAGYAGPLLALDDDRAVALAAGPTVKDLFIIADSFEVPPDARGVRFAADYTAKYGRTPSRFAANAYDAVSILADGVHLVAKAGGDPPGGARLREALLAQRSFPSVYGGQVRIGDDGAFEHPLALLSVADGTETFVRYVTSAP